MLQDKEEEEEGTHVTLPHGLIRSRILKYHISRYHCKTFAHLYVKNKNKI